MAAELEGRYLIALMRCLILEKPLEAFSGDWAVFYKLVCRHSMVTLVYDSLKKNGVELPEEVERRLREAYWKAVSKEGIFQHEYECMKQEFLKYDIHMTPLKGSVIKHYYPKVYHRSMSDMDILIRPEDQTQVKECMKALGYTVEHYGGGCVDVYYKQPVVNVEIHHVLFNFKYDTWLRYFQKVIAEMHPDEEGVYHLSKEDTYLYLLTHMAKHLQEGGSGIRPVLDVWLYLRKEELQFDVEYVNKGLKMLRLQKLHERTKKLGEYWMNPPEEPLEDLERLTDFLIWNGIYGTGENRALNDVNHKEGFQSMKSRKSRVLWEKCFPSFETLCIGYPILKKCPVLLPVIQLRRAWRLVTKRESRAYVGNVMGMTQEKLESMRWYMNEFFDE